MSYGFRNSFQANVGAENEYGADLFALSTWPKVHVETSIRIARGATRQMLLTASGERLNPTTHTREPVCSVEITNQTDGKVSVVCRDTPFPCVLAYGSTYNSIAANKRVKLRANQRNGGAWVLNVRHYRLEITPGETLVVTHKGG
jgi:hypothetical protein